MPVDALLHGVDVQECHSVLAGQQRRAAGQVCQQQPAHLLQMEHVPPGEGPEDDPSVDGARTPPNRAGIAPCRSTSMSSMLSAPAIIPAARQPTFTWAFTPHR